MILSRTSTHSASAGRSGRHYFSWSSLSFRSTLQGRAFSLGILVLFVGFHWRGVSSLSFHLSRLNFTYFNFCSLFAFLADFLLTDFKDDVVSGVVSDDVVVSEAVNNPLNDCVVRVLQAYPSRCNADVTAAWATSFICAISRQ